MTQSPINPARTPSGQLDDRPHSPPQTLSGLTPRRCGTPCGDRTSAREQDMTQSPINPAHLLSSHGGGPEGVSPSGQLDDRPHSLHQTLPGLTPRRCGTPVWR